QLLLRRGQVFRVRDGFSGGQHGEVFHAEVHTHGASPGGRFRFVAEHFGLQRHGGFQNARGVLFDGAGDAQTGPHDRQAPHGIPDMVDISELPAEENDRAVPGAWEGDLVIGRRNASAIGTLVERQTGYVMLPHLPNGYKPEQVRDALAAKMQTLPDVLRGSLTWDQGAEMRDWKHVRAAADIAVYFADPHSPWQ